MDKVEKLDLRVKRTRKLIRDAFIELLQKESFNKITINALTKKAEINRVTFYLHYKDINDMVERTMDELITDIEQILQTIYEDPYEPGYELHTLIALLEYIAEHSQIYKTFLVHGNFPYFKVRLMDFLYHSIVHSTKDQSQKKLPTFPGMKMPKDIAAWYGTSALIGTISMWLANDMPYTPKYLAEQIVKLNPFRPKFHNETVV